MATGILPAETAIYAVPLVTLLLGILIGYLAQRSGFCSIGGFRDYFLFRHTRILSGYLALIVFSFLGREWGGTKNAAFLLCSSPYMSRVPVYMLRFLAQAVKAGLHPELYCYLDGVHALHDGQRSSEFENIGRGVSTLAETAVRSCRDPCTCHAGAVFLNVE